MAQPRYVVEYLGAISVKQGIPYTTASVITAYPTANMMKMKTVGVSVSINNTEMFSISYDDESYITTGKSYLFNKDCTISIGRYVPVV